MFAVDSYAMIWGVKEVKDKYTVCNISTSRKDKNTGQYVKDFADARVRFVGKAHQQKPQANQKIKITNCGVTSVYDKEKKQNYITFIIFDYELDNPSSNFAPIEEDLPFVV